MKRLILSAAIVSTVLATETVTAQEFFGRARSIQSGDTFVADVYGRPWMVRINDITAPAGGPEAKMSRAHLRSLIGGQMVRVNVTGTDSRGRMLASVLRAGDNLDISSAQLAKGLATSGYVIDTPSATSEYAAAKAPRLRQGTTTAAAAPVARTSGSGNVKEDEIKRYLTGIPEVIKPRSQ